MGGVTEDYKMYVWRRSRVKRNVPYFYWYKGRVRCIAMRPSLWGAELFHEGGGSFAELYKTAECFLIGRRS